MSGDKFTCAQCGGTYEKAWTDEESDAEYAETMPRTHAAGLATSVICDDCYQGMVGALKKWDGELQ